MTVTVTQVASAASATELAAADGSRTSLSIANTDPNRLYWILGTGTPTTSYYTDYLDENESVVFDGPDIKAAVQGIWAANGSGFANVTKNTDPVSDSNGATIGTYAELKTTIANWLRPGSTPTADMTARIPQYVGLAEVMIRRELHLRALDQVDTALAVDDGTAAVPTGFQAVLSMRNSSSPYELITEKPVEYIEALDPTATGNPVYRARVGSLFRFWPPTDATVRFMYRRNLTPLSADDDTNWLLAGHPDCYLYGSLIHADRRLIGPRLGEWKEGFAQAVDSIQRIERKIATDIIRPMPNGAVA